MPSGRTADSVTTALRDHVTQGWRAIPDFHRRVFKIGVGLLLGTAILAPIAFVLLYLSDYTGPIDHFFSATIGFEMGAVSLIAFGFSGFAVLFYDNGLPTIASLFVVSYTVLFGGFYWATFQLLRLEWIPVLVGCALPPALAGASELRTRLQS